MDYCFVNADGIIVNIIVADDPAFAAELGALPSYEDARIGAMYNPPVVPEPEPEPEPGDEPSVWDELDAAYTEGVNGAYDE